MPKRTFTFTIPELTPSLNKLVKGRTHWREYRKEREDWYYRVKLATQEIDIPPAAVMEARKVEVMSYRVSLLDPDNLAGGMKILWDALIAAGVIYDDGPNFLTAVVGQAPVRKRRDEKTDLKVTIF